MAGNLGKKRGGAGTRKPSTPSKPKKPQGPYKGAKPGLTGSKPEGTPAGPSGPSPGARAPGPSGTLGPTDTARLTPADYKRRREERNQAVYQGTSKPTNKHEKKLARRGKAVRRILAGTKAGALKGRTPYQNLSHTGALREATRKKAHNEVERIESKLRDKKLNPTHREKLKVKLTENKATLKRLEGRKHMANVHALRKESRDIEKEFERIWKHFKETGEPGSEAEYSRIAKRKRKVENELLKAAEKERKQAEKDFQKSHKREKKVEKTEDKIEGLPTTKG